MHLRRYIAAASNKTPSPPPSPPPAQVQSGVTFRTVTPYLQVPSGQVTVGIRPAGAAASTPFSASATLNVASGKVRRGGGGEGGGEPAGSGRWGFPRRTGAAHFFHRRPHPPLAPCHPPLAQFYTAGFLGMVPAPDGFTPINSAPVLVNEDVRSMPSPGRFSGLWYRWSETNVVIDFRTVGGDPAPADVSGAFDVERITDLQPKTVIPIGELPTGRVSSAAARRRGVGGGGGRGREGRAPAEPSRTA